MNSRLSRSSAGLSALVLVILCATSGAQEEAPKAPAPPVIHRIDRDLERVLDAAAKPPTEEDRAALLASISEQKGLYALLGHRSPEVYARILLEDHSITRDVIATRAFFARRDLDAEVRDAYALVTRTLARRPARAPRYWLIHGWSKGTNAQSRALGSTREGARVFLNLPALARGRHFEAAIVHEAVHVVQGAPRGVTLLDRALYEGIATYLTRRLDPRVGNADALFWSEEAWAAAEARRGAILAAFARRRDARHEREMADFIYLGQPLRAVPGAPDRCAYYVGTLAVRAWMEEKKDRAPRDLLDAAPAALWAALERVEAKRKAAPPETDGDRGASAPAGEVDLGVEGKALEKMHREPCGESGSVEGALRSEPSQ